jgi:hypothetical protein
MGQRCDAEQQQPKFIDVALLKVQPVWEPSYLLKEYLSRNRECSSGENQFMTEVSS